MDPKKLIEVYKEASKYFYNNKDNSEQKSKHWEMYNSREFTLDNLINFRNNQRLSRSLDDDSDSTFKIYSEIISKVSEPYVLKNLPKKNIGNSNHVKPFKDVFLDYHKLIQIYWFWIIENKILKNFKIDTICDIGGGFGSFADLFIKNYNTKIFLIDLPEANLMSTYYLKELYPKKKFYLFDDYKKNRFLSKLDFERYDIIILPPNCKIDKSIKIDFFINSRSFMEMNFNIIKSYFDFIHNHIIDDGYFLNINRYEKNVADKNIRISEYPYDKNWKVIVSEPSFSQKWIHFLLTQRSFKKNETNILEELSYIKNIGKKFYNNNIHGHYKPRLLRILRIIFGNKIFNYIKKLYLKINQ